jgi:hypothetical protein
MITEDEVVLMDIVRKEGLSQEAKGFVRAGPRAEIVWAPGEVKGSTSHSLPFIIPSYPSIHPFISDGSCVCLQLTAAIATCGGLCPGFVTLHINVIFFSCMHFMAIADI